MEIIISANEVILAMARNKAIKVNKDMTEKDFYKWTQGITKDINEDGLQEISI